VGPSSRSTALKWPIAGCPVGLACRYDRSGCRSDEHDLVEVHVSYVEAHASGLLLAVRLVERNRRSRGWDIDDVEHGQAAFRDRFAPSVFEERPAAA